MLTEIQHYLPRFNFNLLHGSEEYLILIGHSHILRYDSQACITQAYPGNSFYPFVFIVFASCQVPDSVITTGWMYSTLSLT